MSMGMNLKQNSVRFTVDKHNAITLKMSVDFGKYNKTKLQNQMDPGQSRPIVPKFVEIYIFYVYYYIYVDLVYETRLSF